MQESHKIILSNKDSYTYSIFRSISECEEAWNSICDNNVYFQRNFLNILEGYGPLAYHYYYVIISKDNRPIGILYCQRKTIKLAEDFRVHTHSKALWDRTRVSLTKWLFKFVKHQMLICGNVLLTGEYGFQLDSGSNNELVEKVLDGVAAHIKASEKIKIKTTMVKDFHTSDSDLKKREFLSNQYYAFKVQPDMMLPLRPEWNNYADYLAAVKSKYRVKFKKIKKKGKDLVFREINADEVEQYNAAMYKMYRNTADRATFNLFTLNDQYFARLKQVFKENLNLTGVFLEDKLVAFFTLVKNEEIADAHFLGYNVQLNSKYQLYFNILLRLVEQAIESKSRYLNLSRTALEIKSSVGAQPYDLTIHIKYHNKLVNQWVPFILKKFVPEDDWLPRSPFK